MWIFTRRTAGRVAALALIPIWPGAALAAPAAASPAAGDPVGPVTVLVRDRPAVGDPGGSVAAAVRAAVERAAGVEPGPSAAETGPAAGITTVGGGHVCAIVEYTDLWCWGAGADGQLGGGALRDSARPVRVSAGGPLAGAAGIVAVHAGRVHTCALALDYAAPGLVAYCWGSNDEGQLGDGTFTSRARPRQVAADAVQVVTGAEHTCLLRIDQTVSCWGRNDQGQLGTGAPGPGDAVPQQVPGLTGIVDLAAGADSTCALGRTGRLWCWGSDAHGQLGDGAGSAASGPVAVGGGPYSEVSVGSRHACALGPRSRAFCWGAGDRGQIGRYGDRAAPVRAGGRAYTGLRAGGDSTCGIVAGGSAYCWGANDNGQLGAGDSGDRDVPVAVDRTRIRTSTVARLVLGGAFPALTDVAVGGDRSCAVDAALTVYCTRYGVLTAVPLAPGLVTGVRADVRPGGLRVGWSAPADPGADRIAAYVALAFPGTSLDDNRSCTARTARTCTITGLTGDRSYTVLVAAVSHGGVSYSALVHAVPAESAGLPVTGPGPLMATGVVLLTLGAALLRGSRSVRCRHRPVGAAPAGSR